MANCFFDLSHKCLLSIKKLTPWSFNAIGYSSDIWTTSISVTSISTPLSDLVSACTVPLIFNEDSWVSVLSRAKTFSDTSFFDTTHCTSPEPSLTITNQIFPIDLILYTHPLTWTSFPIEFFKFLTLISLITLPGWKNCVHNINCNFINCNINRQFSWISKFIAIICINNTVIVII